MTLNSSQHVYDALKVFGAPLKGIAPKDFEDPQMILQIGVTPVRIDILMTLPGVSPEEAWAHRTPSHYGKEPINILGKAELIAAKKVAGRPQDKLDITKLLRRPQPKRNR